MTEKTVVHMNRDEWESVLSRAESEWREREGLGTSPTRREARESLGLTFNVHPLNLLAVPVFLVLTLLTALKAILHAQPVAALFYSGLAEGAEVLWVPEVLLTGVFALTFALMSEIGLVYFVLLAANMRFPEVENNTWGSAFRYVLNVRVWLTLSVYLTVVGILAFQVQISWVTGVSLIDKLLPLLAGLAFSLTVKNLVSDYTRHRERVTAQLLDMRERYQAQVKNQWNEDTFLSILGDNILDGLVQLARGKHKGRPLRVNAWLEQADNETRRRAVAAEYQRHTAGRAMAKAIMRAEALKEVVAGTDSQETPKETSQAASEGTPDNAEGRGGKSESLKKLAELPANSKERPGGAWWSVDELANELWKQAWENASEDEVRRVFKRAHPSTVSKAVAQARRQGS